MSLNKFTEDLFQDKSEEKEDKTPDDFSSQCSAQFSFDGNMAERKSLPSKIYF